MPTFPTYVKLSWKDSGDQPKSIMERSEMDRGVPKQRRIAADTLVSVPVTLFFDSKTAADNFEAWFYGGDGLGWFDFTLPRTGAVVSARIVGGNLGQLKPLRGDWTRSQRQITLEYLKAAL